MVLPMLAQGLPDSHAALAILYIKNQITHVVIDTLLIVVLGYFFSFSHPKLMFEAVLTDLDNNSSYKYLH